MEPFNSIFSGSISVNSHQAGSRGLTCDRTRTNNSRLVGYEQLPLPRKEPFLLVDESAFDNQLILAQELRPAKKASINRCEFNKRKEEPPDRFLLLFQLTSAFLSVEPPKLSLSAHCIYHTEESKARD
jgi:hypothetical protein